MKIRTFVTAIFCLLVCCCAAAQDQYVEAGTQAAKSWLAVVDNGNYDKSWDLSASYFKHAITRDGWEDALDGTRAPLGSLVRRHLKAAQFATQIPGAPDGKYVVMQFATSFENKFSALETVTAVFEKDGKWRVTGYFIR